MNKHIPCKRCDGRGFINWTFSEGNTGTATSYVCPDCNGSGVSVVPMTNADRIRAMSDEELAEFLIDLANDGNLRIKEWLQQPAEEDKNGV